MFGHRANGHKPLPLPSGRRTVFGWSCSSAEPVRLLQASLHLAALNGPPRESLRSPVYARHRGVCIQSPSNNLVPQKNTFPASTSYLRSPSWYERGVSTSHGSPTYKTGEGCPPPLAEAFLSTNSSGTDRTSWGCVPQNSRNKKVRGRVAEGVCAAGDRGFQRDLQILRSFLPVRCAVRTIE